MLTCREREMEGRKGKRYYYLGETS